MRLTRIFVVPFIGVMFILAACSGGSPSTEPTESETPAITAPAPSTTDQTPATPNQSPAAPDQTTTTAPKTGFTLSELKADPDTPEYGEDVEISVKVTNNDAQQATYKAVFKVNGATVTTKDVTLAGGASETVHFSTLAPNQDGLVSIAVGDLTGKFAVLGR